MHSAVKSKFLQYNAFRKLEGHGFSVCKTGSGANFCGFSYVCKTGFPLRNPSGTLNAIMRGHKNRNNNDDETKKITSKKPGFHHKTGSGLIDFADFFGLIRS